MYGTPNSYSDWARHFEKKRERQERVKRIAAVVASLAMVGTGIAVLVVASCAPFVPV